MYTFNPIILYLHNINKMIVDLLSYSFPYKNLVFHIIIIALSIDIFSYYPFFELNLVIINKKINIIQNFATQCKSIIGRQKFNAI